MDAMRVGIVGVGMICDTFISSISENFSNLEVVACTARNMDHIKAKAQQYGIMPMTKDELFGDSSIGMVINLTPVEAHYEIIKRSLESGKHVYTEKTLAASYLDAKELADLSQASGLYLGCAPDTFLGSATQTAAEAVDSGLIGNVTGFTIMLNRGLDFLYDIMNFLLQPGAGFGYDYGVYALTSVLSILGPATEVCGIIQTNRPSRKHQLEGMPNYGEEYEINNENMMTAVIHLKSGVLGTVMFNGDSIFPERPYISIQGTKGILHLPNAGAFGGEVRLTSSIREIYEIMGGGDEDTVLPVHHKFSEESRGIGAAEMVSAIREKRANRASKEMACHVLELLDCISESSRKKTFCTLTSSFDIPLRLTGNEKF